MSRNLASGASTVLRACLPIVGDFAQKLKSPKKPRTLQFVTPSGESAIQILIMFLFYYKSMR